MAKITIEIEETTWERLQGHAKPRRDAGGWPSIDSPDSVIRRALDALESISPKVAVHRASGAGDVRAEAIDPTRLPDLKHTKVLAASMDKEPVRPANWNSLLRRLLVVAVQRFGDLDHVQSLCGANLVQGIKEDEGYHHLAEAGISYQGTSSNSAVTASIALAKALGVQIDVDFQWRQKPGAHRPGQRSRLHIPASTKVK